MINVANPRIAVVIPCYNEALTIEETIKKFQSTLPNASIHVCDNNSNDDTAKIAHKAGANVLVESMPGKGYAVRRLFANVEADIYILVDGDCTYDHTAAPLMIEKLINEQLDMVVGARVPVKESGETYRPGHQFGNKLFTHLVSYLFGKKFNDIFSGYRVFSKRFIKTFPAKSKGFEIETELTVHSLELGLPVAEIETNYYARPEGSHSKLKSYRDGFRILSFILSLLKEIRPLFFFSFVALGLIILALILFIPILIGYWETHTILRIPTIILSTGLVLVAVVSFACGIILDNVCESRREIKKLFYLTLPK